MLDFIEYLSDFQLIINKYNSHTSVIKCKLIKNVINHNISV